MAVAIVAPSARPVIRPSPGNCSAVATAPTALTAPASNARMTAPASACPWTLLAINENMVTGSAALPRHKAISTGLRPTRSLSAPVSGVTAITATAAMVDSHKASPSLKRPTEVRKAGT